MREQVIETMSEVELDKIGAKTQFRLDLATALREQWNEMADGSPSLTLLCTACNCKIDSVYDASVLAGSGQGIPSFKHQVDHYMELHFDDRETSFSFPAEHTKPVCKDCRESIQETLEKSGATFVADILSTRNHEKHFVWFSIQKTAHIMRAHKGDEELEDINTVLDRIDDRRTRLVERAEERAAEEARHAEVQAQLQRDREAQDSKRTKQSEDFLATLGMNFEDEDPGTPKKKGKTKAAKKREHMKARKE